MNITDEAVEAAAAAMAEEFGWEEGESIPNSTHAAIVSAAKSALTAALPNLSQVAVRVSAPLHDALQRWRDEDHEETIALSREQVIEVCEEFRALSPAPVGVTDERKFKAAPADTGEME